LQAFSIKKTLGMVSYGPGWWGTYF